MAVADRVPTGPPQGTAADPYRLFVSFSDGAVFDYGQPSARDLDSLLRSDGKARTLEQVLTLPILSAPTSIEPGKGDKGEADKVRDLLERPANAGGMSTPLDLVIAQMTSAVVYRRAFFEKTFTVDGGTVGYDSIAFRPPMTCTLKRDPVTAAFGGFYQEVPRGNPNADALGRVLIKPDRAFVYIHGQRRDPLDGTTDLDIAYTAWKTKQKVFFLWYQFLENQSLPKTVVTAANSDDTQLGELVKAAAALKSAGVLGLKQGETASALESAGRGADQFKQAIEFLNAEAAGSVLAGFTDLTAGAMGGRGSYALSRDQTDMFLQSRQAVATEMAAAFTSWVIGDLVKWNFGAGASVPTFKFGPLVRESADQAISLLTALAASAPNGPIPVEFVHLLAEKVAALLDLDAGAVHAAIVKAQAQAAVASPAGASPVGQMAAGVDAITQDPTVQGFMRKLQAVGVGGDGAAAAAG